jgi:ParB family chromosome partitioning protein
MPTRLPSAAAPAPATTPARPEHANTIAIDQIDPNPVQPRRVFQADSLHQLADSIRSHGIIQPLVVRLNGERFQLVAGERRWRAARIGGLSEVPAVVQEFRMNGSWKHAIENVQREDQPNRAGHGV